MMFREPLEEERAELRSHLELLAWAYTRQTAGLGDTEPYRSAKARADGDRIVDQAYVTENAYFYQAHRKDMHLQWLRTLRHLAEQIEPAAEWLARLAAGEGANYREIGEAWGITRQ